MQSFFDPLLTSDGKPYATERFRQIVQERYIISKHSNTSYIDTLEVTPTERTYLIQFILDDLQKQKDMIDKQKQKK